MKSIHEISKQVLLDTIIRKNISRHFKRLAERLNEIDTPTIIMEAISKEFRFLENDLINDSKEVNNGMDKDTY